MILAIDVHYKDTYAKAAGVLFSWSDDKPKGIIIEKIKEVEDYIPGQFFKRELPCLLKIIDKTSLNEIDAILIDGYVYIDDNEGFGLGGYLWSELGHSVPVIGVAKTSFLRNKGTILPINRGVSKNPLFISSIGIDLSEGASLVKNMKGDYRVPEILKAVDRITKEM